MWMSAKKGRQPTIVDIAQAAAVSKSTVARALSGSPHIGEETRKRVISAASVLGYERNQLAMSLRSGRSGMIGLVIPDIANPFWAEVARGAQDEAVQNGSTLLIFSSDWDADREASHLRALRQARVDGALVNPVADNIDAMGRFGLPVVLIGSSAGRYPELSSVGSDIAQGARLGFNSLVSLGHRRPMLLVGATSRLAKVRFLRVTHDACIENGIDPSDMQILEADYTVESAKAAVLGMLSDRKTPPTCIFAANDLMGLGAMLAVREAGLSCPADVSILGFDGIPAGEFSDPGLTTVEKPARDLGTKGVKLLVDVIDGKIEHQRMFLPCAMKLRGSLTKLEELRPVRMTAVGGT